MVLPGCSVEYSSSSGHPAAGYKTTTFDLVMKTVTKDEKSCVKVCEPTCRLFLTLFTCFRTSSKFLFCMSVDELDAEMQQAAKRQKTTNFILSEWAADHQKMLFWRFTGNADGRVAYLFIRIPEDTGKPLAESWKAAETGVCE